MFKDYDEMKKERKPNEERQIQDEKFKKMDFL